MQPVTITVDQKWVNELIKRLDKYDMFKDRSQKTWEWVQETADAVAVQPKSKKVPSRPKTNEIQLPHLEWELRCIAAENGLSTDGDREELQSRLRKYCLEHDLQSLELHGKFKRDLPKPLKTDSDQTKDEKAKDVATLKPKKTLKAPSKLFKEKMKGSFYPIPLKNVGFSAKRDHKFKIISIPRIYGEFFGYGDFVCMLTRFSESGEEEYATVDIKKQDGWKLVFKPVGKIDGNGIPVGIAPFQFVEQGDRKYLKYRHGAEDRLLKIIRLD